MPEKRRGNDRRAGKDKRKGTVFSYNGLERIKRI